VPQERGLTGWQAAAATWARVGRDVTARRMAADAKAAKRPMGLADETGMRGLRRGAYAITPPSRAVRGGEGGGQLLSALVTEVNACCQSCTIPG